MTRKFDGDTLIFATHNLGKLEEVQAILKPYGVTVKSNRDFNLGEPEETEETFLGNARIKANAAVAATSLPCLADDSGIIIDGLDGAPGIHTADWAETPSGRDFKMAMTRAWTELEERKAPFPRTARFHATMVLAWPDGHEEVFVGECEGQVVWPMRGVEGHGYDPMFMPTGYDMTLGEMDAEEKNRISHRAKALNQFISACFA